MLSANFNNKTMIVNGFNIDDPEEASEYLKSLGVDVDTLVKRGLQKISEIQRNQALRCLVLENRLAGTQENFITVENK